MGVPGTGAQETRLVLPFIRLSCGPPVQELDRKRFLLRRPLANPYIFERPHIDTSGGMGWVNWTGSPSGFSDGSSGYAGIALSNRDHAADLKAFLESVARQGKAARQATP